MSRSQTGHEVRNARTRCCNRHPGLAGHASNAPGDEGCILFVPADYRLNGGVAQGIEYFVNLAPGTPKTYFVPWASSISTTTSAPVFVCSATSAFILLLLVG